MGLYGWRIGKAERFLESARQAFEQGQWETSVSRAYYAAYHLVAALLEARGPGPRRRWNHTQLLNVFNDHFARRGYLFAKKDAGDLSTLMQERLTADYEDVSFDEKRARRCLDRAEALCQKILEVVHDA